MLRVVRHVAALQRLFSTFLYSLPALANISFFMFILYYIFGALATESYGIPDVYPVVSSTYEANCQRLFASVPSSILTLLRAGMFDNWLTMMNACYIKGSPALCDPLGYVRVLLGKHRAVELSEPCTHASYD